MRYFRTFLGILALCTYAGCVVTTPSDSTLSYISSSQQVGESPDVSGKPQQLPVKDFSLETRDGKVTFRVQVADTGDTRATGLMFRESMGADEGMVFLFDEEQPLTFWMKNTLIPLDMVFLDKDWKVLSIQKSAQPCEKDPCVLYPSKGSAKYVLEINAGLSDKLGIQEGTGAQLAS